MSKQPKAKPKLTRDAVENILKANKLPLDKVHLVGIRGYYLDSMGEIGVPDRGLYDSAFAWIGPNVFATFNGNTSPSRYRKGWGKGSEKGMAELKTGVWQYKPGTHYGAVPHAAFRQAADVTVIRDGTNGNYEDVGQFGINIHKGGSSSTSSLGCQTIPPSQWELFRSVGYSALKQAGQDTFSFVLIDERNRRKGALKA